MVTILVTCIIALVVIYIIQVLFSTETRHYKYRYRGWWFIYLPKWFGNVVSIRIRQFLLPKRLNFYDTHARSYELCGIVTNALEARVEEPIGLITDRHEDGMLIWGGDKDGRMIVAKVVRLSKRRASVFLMIKDEKGNLYTLPNQPDTNVVNIDNEEKWVGNGLLLECVEPMRTWRVKFNGMLRMGTRNQYITECIEDDDDSDVEGDSSGKSAQNANQGHHSSVIHVRFDFLWKSMRSPVDLWRDASSRLLAHSLAREAYAQWSSFRSLDKDGYDQWGALHGMIKIGTEDDPSSWYLRGARQHRWGMSDSATNLQRSISLFSCFDSGDILCLEGFSFKSGISHCVMGYLQTASGFYYPVTSSSLELSEIHDENDNLNNIFVSCTVGGKKLHLWWRLFEGMSVYSGDPWTLKHDIRPSHSVSTMQGDGWGFVFLTNMFGGLCPVPERECLSLPNVPSEVGQDKVLALSLANRRSSLVSLTGGKGSSLSYLKFIESNTIEPSLQFKVPNGIIVTNHAWLKQVESSLELKNAITQLEKVVGTSQNNKIKEECLKLGTHINSMQMGNDIALAVEKELTSIFKEEIHTKRFAVRSSACGEDSSDASSAGQNETILGCYWKNGDALDSTSVIRAIVLCWSSQFSFQSVEYRRQRGQLMNGGMAVVVQEMVPANVAGVIFTRDPASGSPESVVISANYGLGESVVSASAEPDTIRVRRTWRNKLKIGAKIIGEKKSKVVMKDDGGTKDVEILMDESKSFCLTDECALKLSKIAIYIEDYFGSPRDIEFAVNQDKIFLLQARPLTFLDEWTDYEIIHELDTAIISDKEICTIGNVGEVFNGYITPLTISLVVKTLDCSLQRDFVAREWPSYSYEPIFNKSFVMSTNHCLLNVGEILYRGVEETITMVIKSVDLCIWGRLITTPKMHQWAVKRFGVMSSFANIIRTSYAFMDVLLNSRRIKSVLPMYSSYEIDTSRITSGIHLFKEISRRVPELSQISLTHCHTSTASTMTQCIALVMLAEKKGEINAAMIQDMAALLACISRTESAEVPTSLKTLASTISEDHESEEFLQMTPDEGKVWLESHPEKVGEVFRNFLFKHGHRCINEFELRSLSWGMAPEALVSTLQTMVKNPASFSQSTEPPGLDQVFDNLNSELSSSKRRTLQVILNLCGGAVTKRETSKSLLIKTVDAFRKAYRTLGQLMVLEGRLPDSDLIFFLQHKEIDELLEKRSVGLVTKAIKRRRFMSKSDSLEFPELTYGVPVPITEDSAENYDDSDSSDTIKGTPVCTGIVKGTARVITSLNQATQIQNGDILITYCTDVGWTPYFPLLSGVVTEIGGLISHGAVVAREYGLPCIVGAKGATSKITSGETVMLNGKEGFIKMISKNVE